MHDQVTCPKCGNEFAVGEALREQMQTQMRVQMKDELQRALDEAKVRAREQLATRTAEVDVQLAEARKRADDAAAKEADVLRKQRELEDREAKAGLALEQQLATERAKLFEQAEQTARSRFDAQAAEVERARAQMESELAEARKRADAAAAKEVDLLRMQRDLEDRESKSALAMEQTLAAERSKLLEQAELGARARFEVQAKAEAERVARERAIEAEQMRAESERTRARMDAELATARQQAEAAVAKEADLLRMQRELEARAANSAVELEQKLAAERARVLEQAEQAARVRFDAQAAQAEQARMQMESELAVARKRADEVTTKEADLLRMRRELEERETNAGLELEQKLASERARVKLEAERVVEERLKLRSEQQLEDLRRENKAQVEVVEKDLAEARKRADAAALKEVELLRKQQELDDAKRAMELETEKRLLEERKRIQDQSDDQAAQRIALIQDQTRLRDKEQEEKNAQLQRTIEQMQQRLTQGAQQAQGEAQELVLKDILVEAFTEDLIEDVAKGVRGADLVQHVHTAGREECGVILWESKRTQGWSAGWLEKLRDDQREIGAACAVIVTQALQPEIKNFGMIDGIWVCGWSYASALGAALRVAIKEVHQARRSTDGRETKMHLLYDYLVGHEFRHRVQGVIEAIVSMQDELRAEERAYARIWKKRATTMNRALTQLGSVYGDLQGIVGAKLEDITPLALPSATRVLGASDEEDGDDDDLDGEDVDHVGVVVSPELESALFALIPADGSGIGNGTLRSALSTKFRCSETEFQAAKSTLLAKGYVKKGRGRGGSVSRVVTGEVPDVRNHGAA